MGMHRQGLCFACMTVILGALALVMTLSELPQPFDVRGPKHAAIWGGASRWMAAHWHCRSTRVGFPGYLHMTLLPSLVAERSSLGSAAVVRSVGVVEAPEVLCQEGMTSICSIPESRASLADEGTDLYRPPCVGLAGPRAASGAEGLGPSLTWFWAPMHMTYSTFPNMVDTQTEPKHCEPSQQGADSRSRAFT